MKLAVKRRLKAIVRRGPVQLKDVSFMADRKAEETPKHAGIEKRA